MPPAVRLGWASPGSLHAVDVDYSSEQPASADVTITCAGRTVLTLSNQSADRTLYPRVPVQYATGADLPGGLEEPLLRTGEAPFRSGTPRQPRLSELPAA